MTTAPATDARGDLEPLTAVRFVLGIARLGEGDLAGWWSSQGLNPAVSFALAGFRSTGPVVGAELALLSAVRRHRQILPRLTAVHLFSPHLPFTRWATAYLAELKGGGDDQLIEELRTWRETPDARQALRAWLKELGAEQWSGSTVSAHDLADPLVTRGLFARFGAGYLVSTAELTIPYVDLAP